MAPRGYTSTETTETTETTESMMASIFEEFLATGTVRRKTVTLYADQAAADELTALKGRFADATDDELVAIKDQWDDAKARWDASRADVTLARLTDEIREQLERELPMADKPRPVGRGATQQRIAEAEAAQNEWAERLLEVSAKRSVRAIEYAIERFEFHGEASVRVLDADGTVAVSALSGAQLEALFAMPYGPQWRDVLSAALNEVSTTAQEPDVPFSLANSSDAQD